MRRILLIFVCFELIALPACNGTSSSVASLTGSNRVIDAKLLLGSSAGDWPVFGYNPGHTGYIDRLAFPNQIHGKLLWTQHVGPIFSSPVAGLNMLYIASTDGYLYAFKQDTGKLVWRIHLNTYLSDATPALEGQVLFVAVGSNAIEALDAHNGQMYWKFNTSEKIQAPPLVVGNRVLLASRTTLWALDANSGHLLWKFHRGVDNWPTTGSPAVAGNTVYIGLGSATQLWALNLVNGHLLWSFDTGDRITSEALVKDDLVYVATWHGAIYSLNRNSGAHRWTYLLNTRHNQSLVDGVGGNMALAEDHLYVGDYRGLILSIKATNGKLIWSYATRAQVLATPAVTSGQVYIGSGDGNFYALDIQTGRPSWRFVTDEIRSSASLAFGHLYVGSLNGVVYAFT